MFELFVLKFLNERLAIKSHGLTEMSYMLHMQANPAHSFVVSHYYYLCPGVDFNWVKRMCGAYIRSAEDAEVQCTDRDRASAAAI